MEGPLSGRTLTSEASPANLQRTRGRAPARLIKRDGYEVRARSPVPHTGGPVCSPGTRQPPFGQLCEIVRGHTGLLVRTVLSAGGRRVGAGKVDRGCVSSNSPPPALVHEPRVARRAGARWGARRGSDCRAKPVGGQVQTVCLAIEVLHRTNSAPVLLSPAHAPSCSALGTHGLLLCRLLLRSTAQHSQLLRPRRSEPLPARPSQVDPSSRSTPSHRPPTPLERRRHGPTDVVRHGEGVHPQQ